MWMPLLDYKPLALPAALLDEAQAMKNHGQTLQRLAERGGLSLDEAACIAARIRPTRMDMKRALEVLCNATRDA